MDSIGALHLILVSQLILQVESGLTTAKSCPTISCESPCVRDFGPDGCYSVCACPRTCNDIECGENEECRLVVRYCFRAPCFATPRCFSKIDSCTATPNMYSCKDSEVGGTRWTFNSTSNACQTFRHRGCTPSPNTFDTEDHCLAKCSRSRLKRRPPCPYMFMPCAPDCEAVFKGQDPCPKCDCSARNPCLAVKCNEGEECKLRAEECSMEPCYPQPSCAPK